MITASTRSWRKIHELAHALTHKDINDKWGERRRIGKLGHTRSPNDAKRAIEWEDMAVHKQRELGAQLGTPYPGSCLQSGAEHDSCRCHAPGHSRHLYGAQ